MKMHRGWVVMTLSAMLVLPGMLSGQNNALEKGSLKVAGAGSLMSSGRDAADTRSTRASIDASVSYFVRSGLAVGASLGLGYTSQGEASASSMSLGPQATLYFGGQDAELHPYLSALVGLGRRAVSQGDLDDSANEVRFRASGGLLTFLTPSVGVHVEAFYERFDDRSAASLDSDHFGIGVGFDLFLPRGGMAAARSGSSD